MPVQRFEGRQVVNGKVPCECPGAGPRFVFHIRNDAQTASGLRTCSNCGAKYTVTATRGEDNAIAVAYAPYAPSAAPIEAPVVRAPRPRLPRPPRPAIRKSRSQAGLEAGQVRYMCDACAGHFIVTQEDATAVPDQCLLGHLRIPAQGDLAAQGEPDAADEVVDVLEISGAEAKGELEPVTV